MEADLSTEIARLDTLSVSELRAYHLAAFGEPTHSRHRIWLVRRIAWKLQEQAEGGLSERAQARAAELAKGLNLRQYRPSDQASTANPTRVKVVGLPTLTTDGLAPGTILRREWRGKTILAKVLPGGFEHEGTIYRSLSALANAVTGSRWNGHLFFGLRKRGEKA